MGGRLALGLLLVARMAAATTTTSTTTITSTTTTLIAPAQPATSANLTDMTTVYQSMVNAGLVFGTPPTPSTDYLLGMDATQVVTANGTVVGYGGSLDWRQPAREAVVAPIEVPFVNVTMSVSTQRAALRAVMRGIVNQLKTATSVHGVTPTALSVFWPRANAPGKLVMTGLGCQVVSSSTQAGVPVLDELLCSLATLDAALTVAGNP